MNFVFCDLVFGDSSGLDEVLVLVTMIEMIRLEFRSTCRALGRLIRSSGSLRMKSLSAGRGIYLVTSAGESLSTAIRAM